MIRVASNQFYQRCEHTEIDKIIAKRSYLFSDYVVCNKNKKNMYFKFYFSKSEAGFRIS